MYLLGLQESAVAHHNFKT